MAEGWEEQIVAHLLHEEYDELEKVVEGYDFSQLLTVLERVTRMSDGLTEFWECLAVLADETGPYADRRLIGEAAGIPPSRLYRMLGKHGRPTNRRNP
jgi:hypothetical protein